VVGEYNLRVNKSTSAERILKTKERRTGYLLPTAIEIGCGMVKVGATLVSQKSQERVVG